MDKETTHSPSPTPTPICLNSKKKYIPDKNQLPSPIPSPMYSPTCSGMFD